MEPEDSLPHSQKPATCPTSERNQSSPCRHPKCWRCFNIILSSTPRISKWFFLSGLPTWILYASFMSHIHATFPSYLILLGLIIRIIFGEQYTSLSSALCSLLHFPATSFFVGPNTYSQTPSAYVSQSMLSAKFHTRSKQRDKIIVLCMLIFKFLDSKLKDRRFCTEW